MPSVVIGVLIVVCVWGPLELQQIGASNHRYQQIPPAEPVSFPSAPAAQNTLEIDSASRKAPGTRTRTVNSLRPVTLVATATCGESRDVRFTNRLFSSIVCRCYGAIEGYRMHG
jgi:hypothetical protein